MKIQPRFLVTLLTVRLADKYWWKQYQSPPKRQQKHHMSELTLSGFSLRYGGSPSIISIAITPRLQMSTFGPYCFLQHTDVISLPATLMFYMLYYTAVKTERNWITTNLQNHNCCTWILLQYLATYQLIKKLANKVDKHTNTHTHTPV